MTNPSITIEHNGKTYSGQIGNIKYTRLGFEDHGILTGSVGFEWDGGGVAVGGFVLDDAKDRDARDYTRTGTAYGLDYVIRLIETVGVDTWEQIKGKNAIVLFEGKSAWGAQAVGIAGLTNGKVFIPSEHATVWLEAAS